MKLSEAQGIQCHILDLTKQLNMAINDAIQLGLIVEFDTIQTVNIFGETTNVQFSVTVNPEDNE